MDIERSTLWDQVLEVVNSPTKPVHFYWEADIHANGKTITAIKVLNVDNQRDFENDYAPVMMVDLVLPMGDYAYDVYPFQDALEITLYKTPLLEAGAMQDESAAVQTERFKAILVDKGDPAKVNSSMNTPTRDALNLSSIATGTFQLMSKTLEQLRTRTFGNTFRDCTVEDVLRSVMTTESQKVKVDNDALPKGVEIVPPSNKDKRKHIIIPHGIPLVDIPNYIHLKQGGVYSAGMGYFFENGYWHIYPCYDVERFKDADRTLTVIAVPTNKLPQVERSYLKKGSSVVVLATGEIKFADDSTKQQISRGNGVMFTDARKFLGNLAKVEGNKLVASRGSIANEFIAIPRETGDNYVPLAKSGITSNPFVQFSDLARRNGSVFAFVWENSDAKLIFPGMMVKVIYLKEDEVVESNGVILKAHEYTELVGQGMTSKRHQTRTMVSVFIKRDFE